MEPFPFEQLPPEIQEHIWRQYLASSITHLDLAKSLREITALSKLQTQIQNRLAKSMASNLSWKFITPITQEGYSRWPTYSLLGFACPNYQKNVDLIQGKGWPTFSIRHTMKGMDQLCEYLHRLPSFCVKNLEAIAWNSACVIIEFPLFYYPILYTQRAFYCSKGYFTAWDLLQILVDFYNETFTLIEAENITQEYKPFRIVSIDNWFDKYLLGESGAYQKLLQGQIQRGRVASSLIVFGFVIRLGRNQDPFLKVKTTI